jgi:hypothetical protein
MIYKMYTLNPTITPGHLYEWLSNTYGDVGGYSYVLGNLDWCFYPGETNIIHIKFRYQENFNWFLLRWSEDINECYKVR